MDWTTTMNTLSTPTSTLTPTLNLTTIPEDLSTHLFTATTTSSWMEDVNITTTPNLSSSFTSSSSSTPPPLPKPQYYDTVYQGVAFTLSTLVFLVGFVGNVLVVIVIARSRSMHSPTNCYLLSLAVADCLVLLSGTLPAIPETFYRIDEWPFGRLLCSVLIYAQYVGVDASSLSITAFTIERYIAICHPMKAQTMCTVSRAKRITGGLWLFTVLYCSPWLGLTDLYVQGLSDGSHITKCHFRLARSSYLVLYMFDLVVFYVIPFIISTVLYTLIARILIISTLHHPPSGSVPIRSPPQRCRTTLLEKTSRPQSASSQRRGDSRVQVVRMLVVVVVVFATLWMPYRVMVVYNSFAQHKWMDLWFLMLCRTLIYINCAINPVLYSLMSLRFRRAFRTLLCCGLRHSGGPTQYSDVGADSVSVVKRHTFCSQRRHSHLRSPRHIHSRSHSPDKTGWNTEDDSGYSAPSHTLKVTLQERVKVGGDKVKAQISNAANSESLLHLPKENGAWGPMPKDPDKVEPTENGSSVGQCVTARDSSQAQQPPPLADKSDVMSRGRLVVSSSSSFSVISESSC